MHVTSELLRKMAVGKPPAANVNSVVVALNNYGERFGILQPHRLAHYLCQLLHESASFRYDQEIASGAAYEGRRDLGNTKKGDGKRFKGRSPIQLTGRANYRAFTAWCRKHIDKNCPDFEVEPDLVNTDPWEGLAPLWYWDEGNPDPQGRSLNYYADQNNIEMITRRINGGLNGFEERIRYYDRAALVLLGFSPPSWTPKKSDPAILAFQNAANEKGLYRKANVDGQTGPLTRTAAHQMLVAMTAKPALADDVQKAPVVEEKKVEVEVKVPDPVAVPVKVESLDKPWYKDFQGIKELATGFGATAVAAVSGIPWQTVAAIGGVLIIGGVAFYLIRRNDAKKQDAAVVRIEQANAGAFAKAPG